MSQPTNAVNLRKLGGIITSSIDFKGTQRKIHAEGLFSEQIFGPVNSHKCSCGHYNSKVLYGGKVCPKCGVICTTNDIRSTTFGTIKLVYPVIKLKHQQKFLKIIGVKNKTIIEPTRADYLESTTRYVAVKVDKSEIKIVNRLNDDIGYLTIPFRITGIYSLYLVFKFIDKYLNVPCIREVFEKEYFTKEIKVLPPNLRLVSYDVTKNETRTPDINKHYTTLLKMNKHNHIMASNLEVDEEDWISKIRMNLKHKILDQDIVEPTVIQYDTTTAIYQYYVNLIYYFIIEMLSGKVGLIRNSILGRNIEFSARTVICVDPSIKPYQVRVCKSILMKLWAPNFIYYLTSQREMDYDYCYETILLHEKDNPNVGPLFDEFLEWFCNNPDMDKSRLAFMNRQPTLWRHGIAVVEMVPSDSDDETIGICPLTLEPYNGDFDGDTVALYVIHDEKALQEMYEKAYIKNTVTYDANEDMLATIRHESLYAAYVLTEHLEPNLEVPVTEFNSISDLPETFEYFNDGLAWPVKINGEVYTYGLALFNKWCGFDSIVINKTIDKRQNNFVSQQIFQYIGDNEKYYDTLMLLSQRLLFFISTTKYCPSLDVEDMINIVDDENQNLFNSLPASNVELGYILNESIIDRCLDQFAEDSDLRRLYNSGSRFSRTQLARSCINVGYTADDNNVIVRSPIKSNLMRGLSAADFFLGAPGSRKG